MFVLMAAAILAVAVVLSFAPVGSGGNAMSESTSEPVSLTWEWPADRVPDRRLLVHVEDISAESGGLFGVRQSPSMAAALPDPVVVTATVVAGPEDWTGRRIALRLPRPELAGVAPGDHAGIGVLGENVGICIAKAPATADREAMTQWLADWPCGG